MSPHARSQDDKVNLDDLKEIEEALIKAHQALARAMAGLGQHERELFIFQIGWARGRLTRISERIYRGGDPAPPANDDAEERGSEG